MYYFYVCLNEWMNEWMMKWMNEQPNEWTNVWTNEWMNEWKNKQTNEWMNRQINEPTWTNGRETTRNSIVTITPEIPDHTTIDLCFFTHSRDYHLTKALHETRLVSRKMNEWCLMTCLRLLILLNSWLKKAPDRVKLISVWPVHGYK